MKFKELAYKSTGAILQAGGIVSMIYGFAKGNVEPIGTGFVALAGGQLISLRTRYITITENFDKLTQRISKLEKKLEAGE